MYTYLPEHTHTCTHHIHTHTFLTPLFETPPLKFPNPIPPRSSPPLLSLPSLHFPEATPEIRELTLVATSSTLHKRLLPNGVSGTTALRRLGSV